MLLWGIRKASARRPEPFVNTTPQDSISQLPHKVRQAADDLPANWSQWRRDVRANPSIIFQSLTVRIGFWLLVAVGFYFAVSRAMLAMTPDPNAGRIEATKVATIYVACAKPECARSRLANPPVNFKDWPMKCENCGGQTVYRATQCVKCRNWIAQTPGGKVDCPHCRRAAEIRKPPPKPTRKEATDPDDREDGWGG